MELTTQRQAEKLREQIAALPVGYISKKTIHGKLRYYLQWNENGKKISKYLRDEEAQVLGEQIERRRQLQAELKALGVKQVKKKSPKVISAFQTDVIMGEALAALVRGVTDFQKRICFETLDDFLYDKKRNRVCFVSGLRRTGKTVVLLQAMAEMKEKDFEKTAYLRLENNDKTAAFRQDMQALFDKGIRFVLVDEATVTADFTEIALLCTDVFAGMGMTIVLCGADPILMQRVVKRELYGRAVLIDTTYLPYGEYNQLFDKKSVDDYISHGALWQIEESDEMEESARRYLEMIIGRSALASLQRNADGGRLRGLRLLSTEEELNEVIWQYLQWHQYEFLLSVLSDEFASDDLRLAVKEMKQKETREFNAEEKAELKTCLTALGLIMDSPEERALRSAEPEEHIIFMQPWLRCALLNALIDKLMLHENLGLLSEFEKQTAAMRIRERVREKMLQDIVLLETMRVADRQQKVFRLKFDQGEFHMVIYDLAENCCAICEIRNTDKIVPAQYEHLTDEIMCRQTENRFGKIISRSVLYRGESWQQGGIYSQNVEAYLKALL